jgi:hypothetical protein
MARRTLGAWITVAVVGGAACGAGFARAPVQPAREQPAPKAIEPAAAPDEPPVIDPATGAVRSFGFGDVPPRLRVEAWVRGEPVARLEPGTVYVVWFFATWSRVSRDVIPTMSGLHEAFADKGVRFVGLSVWETTMPAPEGDYLGRLRAFVGEGGEGVGIPGSVGYTGEAGEMAQTWMRGADRRSIPTMFIIGKDGKVAWMGHPEDTVEPPARVLEQVLEGTFDVLKARERALSAQQQVEAARVIDRRLFRAMQAQDGAEAMRLLEQLLDTRRGEGLGRVQSVFELALMENGNAEAYGWALRLSEGHLKDQGTILNNLAWGIATDERLTTRDLDAALTLARRAVEASGGREAFIVDTLARVHFERGEVAEAVKQQTRAVELAVGEAQQAEYRAVLEAYQRGERPGVK